MLRHACSRVLLFCDYQANDELQIDAEWVIEDIDILLQEYKHI
jgi:hypothetical protein